MQTAAAVVRSSDEQAQALAVDAIEYFAPESFAVLRERIEVRAWAVGIVALVWVVGIASLAAVVGIVAVLTQVAVAGTRELLAAVAQGAILASLAAQVTALPISENNFLQTP